MYVTGSTDVIHKNKVSIQDLKNQTIWRRTIIGKRRLIAHRIQITSKRLIIREKMI